MANVKLRRSLDRKLREFQADIIERGSYSEFINIFDIKDVYSKGIHILTIRGTHRLKKGTYIYVEIVDEANRAIPIRIVPASGQLEQDVLPLRRFTFEITDETLTGVGTITFIATTEEGRTLKYERKIAINKTLPTQPIVYRGDWALGERYDINHVVTYEHEDGSVVSYISLIPHISDSDNEPPHSGTWRVFAKGSDGEGGEDGSSAEFLRLKTDSQIFEYDEDGDPDPSGQIINFEVDAQNLDLSNDITWKVYDRDYNELSNNILSIAGDTLSSTLSIEDFSTSYEQNRVRRIEILEPNSGRTDIISVYALREGGGLTVILTNEHIGLPTFSNGEVKSYDDAETEVQVFSGRQRIDQTPDVTFTYTPNVPTLIIGATDTENGYVKVDDMEEDDGYVEIGIVISGTERAKKRFTLSKHLDGGAGEDAKYLELETSSVGFFKDTEGVITPNDITATVTKTGTNEDVRWKLVDINGNETQLIDSNSVDGFTFVSDTEAIITPDIFLEGERRITLKVYTDSADVVGDNERIDFQRPTDGKAVQISNQTHTFQANYRGEVYQSSIDSYKSLLRVVYGNTILEYDENATQLSELTQDNTYFINVSSISDVGFFDLSTDFHITKIGSSPTGDEEGYANNARIQVTSINDNREETFINLGIGIRLDSETEASFLPRLHYRVANDPEPLSFIRILSPEGRIFIKDKMGRITPDDITFELERNNIFEDADWNFGNKSETTPYSETTPDTFTVTPNDILDGRSETLFVQVQEPEASVGSAGTYTDRTTVAILEEGSNALTIEADPLTIPIQTNSEGELDEGFSETTEVTVFYGDLDVTDNYSWSLDPSTNSNFASISGTVITVNGIDEDVERVVFRGEKKSESDYQNEFGNLDNYVGGDVPNTIVKPVIVYKNLRGFRGLVGLSLVFRGVYDSGTEYEKTDTSTSVVILMDGENEIYYYLNPDLPNGSEQRGTPDGANDDWIPFESQFESIATDILLTKDATVRRFLTIGNADLEDQITYGAQGAVRSLGGIKVGDYDDEDLSDPLDATLNENLITYDQSLLDDDEAGYERFFEISPYGLEAWRGRIGGWTMTPNELFNYDSNGGIRMRAINKDDDMESASPSFDFMENQTDWNLRISPEAKVPSDDPEQIRSISANWNSENNFGNDLQNGTFESNILDISGWDLNTAVLGTYSITYNEASYGTLRVQGRVGTSWSNIESRSINTGSSGGRTYEFFRNLDEYNAIRLQVSITDGSVDVSALNAQQYKQITVINKNGIFTKTAPNRVRHITGHQQELTDVGTDTTQNTEFVHGNLGGGSLHTVATTEEAGFMSKEDRELLDNFGSLEDLDQRYQFILRDSNTQSTGVSFRPHIDELRFIGASGSGITTEVHNPESGFGSGELIEVRFDIETTNNFVTTDSNVSWNTEELDPSDPQLNLTREGLSTVTIPLGEGISQFLNDRNYLQKGSSYFNTFFQDGITIRNRSDDTTPLDEETLKPNRNFALVAGTNVDSIDISRNEDDTSIFYKTVTATINTENNYLTSGSFSYDFGMLETPLLTLNVGGNIIDPIEIEMGGVLRSWGDDRYIRQGDAFESITIRDQISATTGTDYNLEPSDNHKLMIEGGSNINVDIEERPESGNLPYGVGINISFSGTLYTSGDFSDDFGNASFKNLGDVQTEWLSGDQLVKYNGTNFVAVNENEFKTDLSVGTRSDSIFTIESSSGDPVEIPLANSDLTVAGLISGTELKRLEDMQDGANNYTESNFITHFGNRNGRGLNDFNYDSSGIVNGSVLEWDGSNWVNGINISANNSQITINAGTWLSGGGSFNLNQSSNQTITVNVSEASIKSAITGNSTWSSSNFNNSDWDEAHSWGDHSGQGYITSVSNSDISGLNISELNNDSGYITGYTVTQNDVTQHEGAISITESQISDFGNYDNYNRWRLSVNGGSLQSVNSNESVDFNGSTGISISKSGRDITIQVDGNVVRTNTSNSAITASDFIIGSDRRLKTDIISIKNGLQIINKLRPKQYFKNEVYQSGFITDEIPKEVDYLVKREGDYESLSYMGIIALNTSAIKELYKENKKLKKKILELENRK